MGAAVKVTRMDHTAQELRALAAKSKNTAQARRLLAIAMVLEGASRPDAARQTAWIDRRCATGCIATTKRRSRA